MIIIGFIMKSQFVFDDIDNDYKNDKDSFY